MTKVERIFFGTYQIAGGLVGFYITIDAINSGAHRLSFIFFGLYIFSLICGINILRDFANAYKLSFINFLIQTIYISSSVFSYYYNSGILFLIRFKDDSAPVAIAWGLSEYAFSTTMLNGTFSIGVNVLPILFCVVFFRIIKNVESKSD